MAVDGDTIVSSEVELEALELRLALEDRLERARSMSFEEHILFSVDEELSDLILLVSQYSEESMQKAMVMTAVQNSDDLSYTGRYPLNLACDTNAPLPIIQFFLRNDPTQNSVKHKDKWGDLPIHTACSRRNYSEVVQLLLESDPSKSTIFMARMDGSLPIHTACR